jgi:hypothetical protein
MRKINEGRVVNFLKDADPKFLKACDKANELLGGTEETRKVKPCKRQASKWLAGRGAAWKFGRS